MLTSRDPTSPWAQDPRSTEELVRLALSEPETEQGFDALALLQYRGSWTELEAGRQLLVSPDPQAREIGTALLGQLGWQERTFLTETVTLLITTLHDPEPDVVAAAAIALGHRGDPRAIAPLLCLKDHPSAAIRFGVTIGLMGHEDEAALGALVELARDPDREVRNWATFALGSQVTWDEASVCTVLLERLTESDPEIRGEALIGLARRGDTRVHAPLIRELEGEFAGDWALEAAELLADPALCPLLLALQARLDPATFQRFELSFARALEACCPQV